MGPLPNGIFLWLIINGGDPKHLLIGTIFQAWKTFWMAKDGSSLESPQQEVTKSRSLTQHASVAGRCFLFGGETFHGKDHNPTIREWEGGQKGGEDTET